MISCASPGSGRGERLITPPVRASPQLPPWVLPGLRPWPLDLLRPTALSWSSAPPPLLLVLPFPWLDLSLLTSMFILSLPGFSLWLFPPACPPSLPTSPWLRSLPSPPLFPVPAACSRHLAAPRQPQPCSGLSSLLSLLLFLFRSISFFCSCPPPTPTPSSCFLVHFPRFLLFFLCPLHSVLLLPSSSPLPLSASTSRKEMCILSNLYTFRSFPGGRRGRGERRGGHFWLISS